MTFISITYAIFLPIILTIYWRKRVSNWRLSVLVIASLIFYGINKIICLGSFWSSILMTIQMNLRQIIYIPLLLLITIINFRLGRAIGINTAPGTHITNPNLSNEDWLLAQEEWNQRRLKLLWMGIGLNVFCLFGFKYIPFVLSNIAGILNLPGIQITANRISDSLIAPLGLSFFVFESIAYLIDVHRGAPASKQLLNFAAYKLFFPKLISGPIVRYHQFTSEMKISQFPNFERCTEGLWLIACGAIKKALIADQIGILVDLCFGNLERAGSGDLWLAIIAYGLQLYLDFSGYVDIARGSAILLGFNLPENFDFPYFSTSIADFWRRWHITLGDWIRNYLYFPLGGSRNGLARTCLNLLIVMLIIGMWHGAAWGFVIWGGFHGIALAIHRLTEATSERINWLQRWWASGLGVLVAWFLTQFIVFISWVFFRLPSIKQATFVIHNLWGKAADVQFAETIYMEAFGLGRFEVILSVVALWVFMGIAYILQRLLKLQLNWPLKLLFVPVSLYCVWVFAPEGGLPYIYFDF
ncbi:MAG TPA: membrane-bound O-acyltransferase family protein [Cyanobacteria bacterium UBA11149]|nr:membrane-bound O-acyltransferase family protein [Cyanobacteria bacterium UBA11367]HBE61152.1 membrane-bound O-acyltransferase family protein [Cyanobacteria bacterium UBA11366]HBK62638.1 membrane-bound O-acyltransferase family protein [Cyanobacteria bacterium UBA11166]HBR76702.1 membrane-bound O-acyltransferase family protein [Cyanobacteria bacterium UBA11159]HBS72359.1 membrane-bound O-acyltransferase family protein [Cyanobacteria bacterium UBA11153]HBW90684.1 membrane-bound O-acyltransfera